MARIQVSKQLDPTVETFSLRGGINIGADAEAIAINELSEVSNYVPDAENRGVLHKREGLRKWSIGTHSTAGELNSLFDGFNNNYVANTALGRIYDIDGKELATVPLNPVTIAWARGHIAGEDRDFVTSDRIHQSTDGTAFSQLSNAPNLPPPSYIAVYNQMIFTAGIGSASLRFTDVGEVNTWPASNEILFNNKITGLATFRDSLLVFGEREIHILNGFSPLDLQVVFTIRGEGTVAHRTITTTPFGLFWWGINGIAATQDLTSVRHPSIKRHANQSGEELVVDRLADLYANTAAEFSYGAHAFWNSRAQRIEFYFHDNSGVADPSDQVTVSGLPPLKRPNKKLYYYPAEDSFWLGDGAATFTFAAEEMLVGTEKVNIVAGFSNNHALSATSRRTYEAAGLLDDTAAIEAVLKTSKLGGELIQKRLRESVLELNQGPVVGEQTRTIDLLDTQFQNAFTRASTAFSKNSSLLLVPNSTNELRNAHTFAAGKTGMLLERASTNSALRSEELDNASWTKDNIPVTADQHQAPTAATSVTAERIADNSTDSIHRLSQVVTLTANANYSWSLWVKTSNHQNCAMRINRGGGNSAVMFFNAATGAITSTAEAGTGSLIAANAEAYGNGWFRAMISANMGGGATNITFEFFLCDPANPTGLSYSGSGTSVFAWGAQVEDVTNFPTSYIATTTGAATRAIDNYSVDLLQHIPNFTLVYEEIEIGGKHYDGRKFHLGDSGNNNPRILLWTPGGASTQYNFRSQTAGGQGDVNRPAQSFGDRVRLTGIVTGNTIELRQSVNGGAETTSGTVASPTLATNYDTYWLNKVGTSSFSGISLVTEASLSITLPSEAEDNGALQWRLFFNNESAHRRSVNVSGVDGKIAWSPSDRYNKLMHRIADSSTMRRGLVRITNKSYNINA